MSGRARSNAGLIYLESWVLRIRFSIRLRFESGLGSGLMISNYLVKRGTPTAASAALSLPFLQSSTVEFSYRLISMCRGP